MKRISDILIVASTKFEVNQIIDKLNSGNKTKLGNATFIYKNLNIDILISGIGIPSTTYFLTKKLTDNKYDLVINIGICGSFKDSLQVGEVVNVIEDEFADLGITDVNNNFLSLFDEGFASENEFPFIKGKLISTFNDCKINLPKVTGITVNATSGNAEQILMRKEKFNADIETMEGAAVAFICLNEGVDFIQIRSISSPVEPRNKENWNIPLAIKNLSGSVIEVLDELDALL